VLPRDSRFRRVHDQCRAESPHADRAYNSGPVERCVEMKCPISRRQAPIDWQWLPLAGAGQKSDLAEMAMAEDCPH